MDMFEKGVLKDQKLNVKSLVSKPEFKQQYLAPIQAMADDEQCEILLKVIRTEASLNDIKVLSKRSKQIGTLKMLFARLTNTDTWAEVQQRYPSQATEQQLECFVECNLKKGVPEAFQDFCQQVVSSDITSTSPVPCDHLYVHSSEEG